MRFRTRHNGPVVKEKRKLVIHQMRRDTFLLLRAAEAVMTSGASVWCQRCKRPHPNLVDG